MTKDFLKDVLAGRKDLLHKSVVQEIKVPKYDELSVSALWPQFSKDENFTKYFAAAYPKGKGPPRDYFFNIVNTLYPEYLKQVMAHAAKQRMTSEGEGMQRESIEISEYWQEQLKSMPYLSQ